jgi:flagellar protein FlgJ
MLNADFKLDRSGFPALPGRPAVAAQGGAGFGQLYHQLQGEVRQFIEQGGGASGGLSPEGLAHRLQAAPAASAPAAMAQDEDQQAWLARIAPLAEQAGRTLGVAPEVLAAQAALETGWGQRPIRQADGSDSHNLFALKATGGWRGEIAEVTTTEYAQGQPEKRREAFRAYAGPAEAFNDFARLLLNSPRYQGALQTGGDALAYGQALQKGGYATDPAYASKLAQAAAQIRGAR